MNTTDLTPKQYGKSFGSDYSDYMDNELPVPPIDWKARRKAAWGCLVFIVIFWSIIGYLIFK